jgi:hypothetical protein
LGSLRSGWLALGWLASLALASLRSWWLALRWLASLVLRWLASLVLRWLAWLVLWWLAEGRRFGWLVSAWRVLLTGGRPVRALSHRCTAK